MDGIWGLCDKAVASNLTEKIGTFKMDLPFQSKEKESQEECIGGVHQTLLWDRMSYQVNMYIVIWQVYLYWGEYYNRKII